MEDYDYINGDLLRVLFDYDSISGIFTRKITTSNVAKKGSIAGSLNDSGYLIILVNGHKYRAHRLAWLYCFDEFPNGIIDHIDGNRTNNRLDNLREATNTENLYNSKIRSDNTTGYKGVSIDKRSNRYRAYITINKKVKSLGYYATALEASEAYVKAAKELHKEFYNENTDIS